MVSSFKKLLSCFCLIFPVAAWAKVELYTSIGDAAFHGDKNAIRAFMEGGADVNEADDLDWTPLHKAAYAGNLGAPEILIDAGADVFVRTSSDMTALHLATAFSCTTAMGELAPFEDFLKTFIEDEEHSADVFSSYCHKVESSKVNTVRSIIHAGLPADVLYGEAALSSLFLAARRGATDIVRVLSEEGKADVNVGVYYEGAYNVTPLHVAAQNGHLGVIAFLLEAGASINAQTSLEKTPLHYAVMGGYPDVVEYLVKAGADVHVLDAHNDTPLILAMILSRALSEDSVEAVCYEAIVDCLKQVY